MKRLIEFIEDKNGKLSLTRVLPLLAFFPATYVLVEQTHQGKLDDMFMAVYLGAFVLHFVGGKVAENLKNASAPH
jgi:hypothetical protein